MIGPGSLLTCIAPGTCAEFWPNHRLTVGALYTCHEVIPREEITDKEHLCHDCGKFCEPISLKEKLNTVQIGKRTIYVVYCLSLFKPFNGDSLALETKELNYA